MTKTRKRTGWNAGTKMPEHNSPVLALMDASAAGYADPERKRACVIARRHKAQNIWVLVDVPGQDPFSNPTMGISIKSWRELPSLPRGIELVNP